MDTIEHIAKHLDMNPLALLNYTSKQQFDVELSLLKTTDKLYKLPNPKKLLFVEQLQNMTQLLIESDDV